MILMILLLITRTHVHGLLYLLLLLLLTEGTAADRVYRCHAKLIITSLVQQIEQ